MHLLVSVCVGTRPRTHSERFSPGPHEDPSSGGPTIQGAVCTQQTRTGVRPTAATAGLAAPEPP